MLALLEDRGRWVLFFKRKIGVIMVASLLGSNPVVVHGQCCADEGTPVAAWELWMQEKLALMFGPIMELLVMPGYSVLTSVNSGSSSVVNAFNGVSKGVVAAEGKSLDMVVSSQALSVLTKVQVTVEHEHNVTGKTGTPNPSGLPNPCTTAGAGNGSSHASVGSQELSRNNHKMLTNLQSKISNSDADLLSRYKTYAGTYQAPGARKNADIQASSLLGGSSLSTTTPDRQRRPGTAADNASGTPVGDSNTLTTAQIDDAKQFILNATRKATVEDITDEAAKTAEGRRFRMMMREEQARNSIALKSFSDALAIRIEVSDLSLKLGSSWNATANTLNSSSRLSGKVSYLDYLTTEVGRRQSNADWYTQISSASPENIAKEKVFLKSLKLRIESDESKYYEKIELLLAQSLINQSPNHLARQKIEQQRARVTGR